MSNYVSLKITSFSQKPSSSRRWPT